MTEAQRETMQEQTEREGRERADEMRDRWGKIGEKTPGAVPALLSRASRERLHVNSTGFVWKELAYFCPVGTEPPAVLSAAYWAPVGDMLLPHDRIRVIDDAGSWEALLVVRAVGPLAVHVAHFRLIAFDVLAGPRGGSQVTNKLGAIVIWQGLGTQWAVLVGQNVLRSGFATSAQAWAWVHNHAKVMEAQT